MGKCAFGTCEKGICKCAPGWFGADCNIKPRSFSEEDPSIKVREFDWLDLKSEFKTVGSDNYVQLEGKYEVYVHQTRVPSK